MAGRVNLALLLLAVFCATFWITDAAVNRQPPPQGATAPAAPARPESRMLVLLIDSLRYETATDPAFMPRLCALAREGAAAKVKPSFTPATAPSVRDIFTGRANSAVLAWVTNFAKVDARVESLFSQMARAGMTSAVYSRYFFDQFGAGVTARHNIATDAGSDWEDPQMAAALAAFARSEADVVVAHMVSTDHLTHQFDGVVAPQYREAFRHADELIAEAWARLPAGATLVVLGDHGHDRLGRHSLGADVPTYGLYVGPGFRPGVFLGTLNLQTHRWLMSQALGLPVDESHYDGAVVPGALRPNARGLATALTELHRTAAAPRSLPWRVGLYLSLLCALGLNLAARGHTPLGVGGWRSLAPWAALAPLVLLPARQVEAGLGLALAVAVAWAWRTPARDWLRWLALPVAGGIFFQAWGRALSALRPAAEQLTLTQLGCAWAVAALAGALWVTPERRPRLMWALLGGALLFTFPSNERLSFPAMFAPLTGCWLVFYLAALARAGGWRVRGAGGRVALLGAGIFLCLQPFATTEAADGSFIRWVPLVAGWSVENAWYVLPLALAVKLLIFLPRWAGWPRAGLAAFLAAGVTALEASDRWAMSRQTGWWLGLLGAMLVGWLAAWWRRRPETRMLGLAWLFVAYRYFVWPQWPLFFSAITLMLGALVLGARLMRERPQPAQARSDALVLGTLGLIVVGWGTCQWSIRYLDWDFAMTWVGVAYLESHVWVFAPLIALKNVLPWLAIAWCLRDELWPATERPDNALLVGFTAKLAAVLMVNIGLAAADMAGGQYLFAAQLSGTMLLIGICVLVMPRAWPAATAAGATRDPPR